MHHQRERAHAARWVGNWILYFFTKVANVHLRYYLYFCKGQYRHVSWLPVRDGEKDFEIVRAASPRCDRLNIDIHICTHAYSLYKILKRPFTLARSTKNLCKRLITSWKPGGSHHTLWSTSVLMLLMPLKRASTSFFACGKIWYWVCSLDVNVAFPNTYIRICQFHVIQAIIRFATDTGGAAKAPCRISDQLRDSIVYKFRELQCCRTIEEWPAYRDTFLRVVEELVMTDEPEAAASEDAPINRTRKSRVASQVDNLREPMTLAEKEGLVAFLHDYFNRNWFTERWIGTQSSNDVVIFTRIKDLI